MDGTEPVAARANGLAEPADEPPGRKAYDADRLRAAVIEHLRAQGFAVTERGLLSQVPRSKDAVRRLHQHAVEERREAARAALAPHEDRFVRRLAPSGALAVGAIRPALRLIDTYKHRDAPLWRWASLHWSVPVSAGYGRRLRFLVVDEAREEALIGLIGLGDPVFAMGPRDRWVGWNAERRRIALSGVMDAFVLGAVPPYRDLLAGKLVASLAVSAEVRRAFDDAYAHRTTVISDRDPDATLALVTTTSALGRSSVYNRLRRPDGHLAYVPLGFTSGSGDFHLSGELYARLLAFAKDQGGAGKGHRNARWPGGEFRNRREVLMRALTALGLPERQLRTHGIRREVFAAPTGSNTQRYLAGSDPQLLPYALSAQELGEYWRTRWALPRRASRPVEPFDPEQWRLFS